MYMYFEQNKCILREFLDEDQYKEPLTMYLILFLGTSSSMKFNNPLWSLIIKHMLGDYIIICLKQWF